MPASSRERVVDAPFRGRRACAPTARRPWGGWLQRKEHNLIDLDRTLTFSRRNDDRFDFAVKWHDGMESRSDVVASFSRKQLAVFLAGVANEIERPEEPKVLPTVFYFHPVFGMVHFLPSEDWNEP